MDRFLFAGLTQEFLFVFGMKVIADPVVRVSNGTEDPQNPFNWPLKRRWSLTLTACTATFLVALNNTAVTVAAAEIDGLFDIDERSFPHSYWMVTSWNAGSALVPLFALPLMEELGVRYGYIISYAIFSIFVLPQAFASNFATLIISRAISGGCAGILISVLGGVIGDIWENGKTRSLPMNIYIWFLMSGLSLGPVMAGVIIRYLSWRWILYIQIIIYVAAFPLFLFFIKETRHSVIQLSIARRSSSKGKNEGGQPPRSLNLPDLKEAVCRPLKLLFSEWVIFSFTLWSAFSLGTVFLFTQSVGQVYSEVYAWSESSCGLVQSAITIGSTAGMLAEFYQDCLYFQTAKRNTEAPGVPIPESRLYLSVPGSLAVAVGLCVYAWSSFSSVHWIVPSIGLAIVGFGSYTVVLAVAMYVTDSYAKYAASALAGVAMGENLVAAFLPLATRSMYTNLGSHWASTLLGLVALVMTLVPVAILLFGRTIRSKSPFMVTASY